MAGENLVMTAEVRDGFTKTLRDLQKQLDQTGKVSAPAARQLTQQWKSVGTEVASTSRTVATTLLPALNQVSLAGLGVGAAMIGVANQVKKWAGNTESISNFSKEIGASRTELAQLRALGERFGQDWGNLQGSLRTFADNARKINVDKQNILEQFGDLGRGIQDKIRTAANFDEAFEAVMKDLQKVRPERARAVSAALFGTEEWALMFRNASPKLMASIRQIKKEANDEADGLAKDFNDNLHLMNKAIDKLIQGAITPAMPQITKFLNAFADPATGGIKRVSDDLKSLASSAPAAMGALGNLYGMITRPGWETFGKTINDVLTGLNKIAEAASKALTPEKGDVTPESSNIARQMTGVLGKPGAGGPTAEDQAKAKASRPAPRATEDYFKEALGPPGDHAKALEKNTSEIKKLNEHIERQTGPGVGPETGAGGGVLGGAGGGVMGRIGSALGAIFGGGAAAVDQGFAANSPTARLLGGGRRGGTAGASNIRYRGGAGRTPGEVQELARGAGAPILDAISRAEGTTRGYNDSFAHQLSEDLSTKTLDEIDRVQAGMRGSSAIGRYQFMRKTLRGLRSQLGLSGDEKFTPEMQDRLAQRLLQGRGFNRWKAGQMSDQQFMNNLASEWAGVSNAAGRGNYEGVGLNRRPNDTRPMMQRAFERVRQGDTGGGSPPGHPAHPRPGRSGAVPAAGPDGSIDVGSRPNAGKPEAGDLLARARTAGVVGSPAPQKVEGSATIDLNIAGLPTPNYRARTSVDGLFKEVNLNKGRSMPMAEDNPVGRAAAGF